MSWFNRRKPKTRDSLPQTHFRRFSPMTERSLEEAKLTGPTVKPKKETK